jgi:hypothetical protein
MIIDFHTHIVPPEVRARRESFFDGEAAFKLLYSVPGSRLAGAAELIANMDREGIDRSVVFGFPWHSEYHFKKNNDYILESVEKFKDRLIGFVTLFPLALSAEGEIKRCLNAGLSGIGELAFYAEPFSKDTFKALEPVAEIARTFEVPVLLHANEPVGHQYPGKTPMTLKGLYDFVRHFPENRFVLAHWGGGIFFYHLMKRDVKEVLRNTWFDTAASPYLYEREIYSIAEKIAGLDKILFGSDFPLLTAGRYFQEMREAGLSQGAMRKICGENAALLLAELH